MGSLPVAVHVYEMTIWVLRGVTRFVCVGVSLRMYTYTHVLLCLVIWSIGGPCEDVNCAWDSLNMAVDALNTRHHIVVSVAAGNEGCNACNGSPAGAASAVRTGMHYELYSLVLTLYVSLPFLHISLHCNRCSDVHIVMVCDSVAWKIKITYTYNHVDYLH